MLYVKTPATTANFGCGFDSIGMAFKLYNELWIEGGDAPLEVKVLSETSRGVPLNENNLIYKTIKNFYRQIGKTLPGIRMVQKDEIPMTRGLGSSAACIVSGLMAANELSGEKLSTEDIVQLASKIEGHPDNVAPAILGGIVIGAMNEKELKYVRIDVPSDLRFAVMIPSFSVSTEKARKLLPKTIPHKDGVFNASRAGLLVASLLTGSYENLNLALDDRFHQPYRKTLISDMDDIFKKSKEYGAKGVFLSGAGPVIIAVLSNNDSFYANMRSYLETKGKWSLKEIETDNVGAVVSYGVPDGFKEE